MAGMPKLAIANGALAGKVFEIGKKGVRVGRASSNDIHVPDEELSRNHCLFEKVGFCSLRVTDLASANGTFVNGVVLGGEPVTLKVGDVVEAGRLVLRIVGDGPGPSASAAAGAEATVKNPVFQPVDAGERRLSARLIPLLILLLLLAGGVFWFTRFRAPTADGSAEPVEEGTPEISEIHYEKVAADSNGIFRCALSLSPDGVLRLALDDVPDLDRHVLQDQPLSTAARAELNEILAFNALREIDREYVGGEPDPQTLKSWTLRVVYASRARSIRVVNTDEPGPFRAIREKLDVFCGKTFGVSVAEEL